MVTINGNNLTISEIVFVARNGALVDLAEDARMRVEQSHGWVNEIVASKRPVYGVNTGFGIFAEKGIPPADGATLSRNLILSHAVCTGAPLPKEIVRAAMLVRANTLAKGHSGVRSEIIATLLAMLNLDLIPIVPSQGSLGSSGDLGPLSHLALVFTTDDADLEAESGFAEFQERILTGKKAMAEAGLARIQLGPKEGLAVNNGATFSAAIAALAIYDTARLLDLADINLAMTLEALLGSLSPFQENINQARGHPGQLTVAENIRWLTRESGLIGSGFRIQDAYSLRCAPQVHGAVRDTLTFTQAMIEREINAATDNPLLFGPCEAVSGGNFHGEPVGMVMDFLKIAVSELAAISERRTFRLADAKLNYGLPPMLVDSYDAAGLNSGVMMLQYTAASLALENQTLATSDSVHNLPTSGEQEDHNANSMTAARNCRQVIANATHVLAIELFTASRALFQRMRLMPAVNPGLGTAEIYRLVQQAVPYRSMDSWWAPEIDKVKALIQQDDLFRSIDKKGVD
jgi:histidine ammonia-lyase